MNTDILKAINEASSQGSKELERIAKSFKASNFANLASSKLNTSAPRLIKIELWCTFNINGQSAETSKAVDVIKISTKDEKKQVIKSFILDVTGPIVDDVLKTLRAGRFVQNKRIGLDFDGSDYTYGTSTEVCRKVIEKLAGGKESLGHKLEVIGEGSREEIGTVDFHVSYTEL